MTLLLLLNSQWIKNKIAKFHTWMCVSIQRNDNSFFWDIYCKPSFTGLGLSLFHFLPISYKINAIRQLLFRAFNSSYDFVNFSNKMDLPNDFYSNKYLLNSI